MHLSVCSMTLGGGVAAQAVDGMPCVSVCNVMRRSYTGDHPRVLTHVCKWLGTGPGVVLLPTVFRVLVDSLPDEAPILWAAHSPNRNHHVCHTSDGNACVGVNDAAAVLAAVGDLAMRSDRLCAVDQGLAATGL